MGSFFSGQGHCGKRVRVTEILCNAVHSLQRWGYVWQTLSNTVETLSTREISTILPEIRISARGVVMDYKQAWPVLDARSLADRDVLDAAIRLTEATSVPRGLARDLATLAGLVGVAHNLERAPESEDIDQTVKIVGDVWPICAEVVGTALLRATVRVRNDSGWYPEPDALLICSDNPKATLSDLTYELDRSYSKDHEVIGPVVLAGRSYGLVAKETLSWDFYPAVKEHVS